MVPCVDNVAATLSMRICQIQVACETKTKDNVFVTCEVAVQYRVIQEQVYEAHYNLSEPRVQIRAYVEDVIRGSVPAQTLDHVFAAKNELSEKIMQKLQAEMREFGFEIKTALITNLLPDASVKSAMNEINAQKRIKDAAFAIGGAARVAPASVPATVDEANGGGGGAGAPNGRAQLEPLEVGPDDFC